MSADLVGRWSIEYGYHSAMEDEELVLRADGTGWCEWSRPGLTEFTAFDWEPTRPGAVRVTPTRAARSESEELVELAVPDPVEVDYTVVEETRPLYPGMEVLALRLPLPFAVFPNESYGLSRRETPDGDRPHISWLDDEL
ncbi:hypothetical protein [Umezawaea tangerina]|uniref:Lipocalin-like protein n=1 Tax=Umezawaea tangerina TaxID=84725 RepID=A0A2T0TDG6_9PSEU|nr:hypothetical protein [Umezawaea tangerina]PRY43707.1 hypothetical protein CLV43_103454 [Umezawaea tangerina]